MAAGSQLEAHQWVSVWRGRPGRQAQA